MKKIIGLLSFTLLLLSCSKDDDQGEFSQIKTISHNESSQEAIKYYDYSEGKLMRINKYTSNNFQTGYTTYKYQSNGLVLMINDFTVDGVRNYTITYSYDDLDRLTFQKYEGKYIAEGYTINYIYNADNTITATRSGVNSGTKTYYLNSNGLIYKEVSGNNIYEATFEGVNPISATGAFTTTFEYNTENNPDLLNNKNKNDLYKANDVLRANSLPDAISSTSNQYLIKKESNSQIQNTDTFNYTFNGNGFPESRMDYHNNVLINEVYYIYK